MYVKCRKHDRDEGEIVGIGSSSSIKGSEQKSAEAALKHFGVINDYDGADDEVEEIQSDDSISDYESEEDEEEINELICKKCNKEFKTKAGCEKHTTTCN
ncbi:hypothetical protein Klosneuvirus_2_245 [Klosneuvirus KNV1]|uniref:Uncharacterized protein n=1 Tax=Klosneuvirus KNV1 TaxID=1977640 RepID=A0A1V0SJB5_9VIRU|nr:hypothetical protein Klosneuvirus_2_245 [Klosneuvirus KNV1]